MDFQAVAKPYLQEVDIGVQKIQFVTERDDFIGLVIEYKPVHRTELSNKSGCGVRIFVDQGIKNIETVEKEMRIDLAAEGFGLQIKQVMPIDENLT